MGRLGTSDRAQAHARALGLAPASKQGARAWVRQCEGVPCLGEADAESDRRERRSVGRHPHCTHRLGSIAYRTYVCDVCAAVLEEPRARPGEPRDVRRVHTTIDESRTPRASHLSSLHS